MKKNNWYPNLVDKEDEMGMEAAFPLTVFFLLFLFVCALGTGEYKARIEAQRSVQESIR